VAAAVGILAWGLLATVTHTWSAFLPGIVSVLLATGVLLVFLLGREAFARSRKTRWLD
jgi:hypothetical protein